jgi:hypothetical protein
MGSKILWSLYFELLCKKRVRYEGLGEAWMAESDMRDHNKPNIGPFEESTGLRICSLIDLKVSLGVKTEGT